MDKQYKNLGKGVFDTVPVVLIDSLNSLKAVACDINNDGADEIVSINNTGVSVFKKVDDRYKYELVQNIEYAEYVKGPSLACNDFDGDGFMDIIVVGDQATGFTLHLSGKADGILHNATNINISAKFKCPSIFCRDFDGDDDVDVFIIGYFNAESNSEAFHFDKCFLANDGVGNFSEGMISLPALHNAFLSSGDIDGDNDVDVIISGSTKAPRDDCGSGEPYTALFINTGNGNFERQTDVDLPQISLGVSEFVDLDSDGDLDIYINGLPTCGRYPIACAYENDGSGNFTRHQLPAIDSLMECKAYFADIDGDMNVDLLQYRTSNWSVGQVNLYRNTIDVTNIVDTVSACNEYTWIDGKTYKVSNYKSKYFVKDELLGDTIYTLHLSINNSHSIDSVSTSTPYTWIDGKTYEHSDSTSTYILTNNLGCDSIIQLYLIFDEMSQANEINIKDVSVLPNPANKLLAITSESFDSMEVEIYSPDGKKLYANEFTGSIEIPINAVYNYILVKVKVSTSIKTYKIFLE